MKATVLSIAMALFVIVFASYKSNGQQYKLRQVTTTEFAKMENTIYVKGKRQRIENGAMMGMNPNLVTILQCDLKRNITLDTIKKLYFIEPFSSGETETTINPAKEAAKVNDGKKVKKGGTINIWYNLRDTGERKEMFGFTARHIWSDQKMKPSADACSMKDSMMMYTDGWYIDFPEFNCPNPHEGFSGGYSPEVECQDKMVMHQSGKAKMGFPLMLTTTMVMSNHKMVTKLETLDLSTAKLDSSLFTIPRDYKEAKSKDELIGGINIGAMMDNAMQNQGQAVPAKVVKENKMPGVIRVGVFVPGGSNDIEAADVQQNIIRHINAGDFEAIAVSSEDDARKYNCDYTLATTYSKIKSATKAANVLKAIRDTDPGALSTYVVQGNLLLTSLKDGAVKSQQNMDGKYDGKINDAAGKAVGEHWNTMKKMLKM